MMQVINYSGEVVNGNEDIIFTQLNKPQSLDEFEINIIDLRDQDIWISNYETYSTINCINDFKSLSIMLENSIKATNIIIYPQNCIFEYDYYSGKYYSEIELKDMLSILQKSILTELHPSLWSLSIHYENTRTKAELNKISASFYFESEDNVLTYSIGSCKATTIDFREEYNLILTTLNLDTYENIISFIKELNLIEIKEEVPEWMTQYKMFDDVEQLSVIGENNDIIKKSQENIGKALDVIKQNDRYKSILYTNGDELVEVVFEILEEILGCDLSGFKDEKKEDFVFVIGDRHFVGEIKGVTSNVRSEHVSQLDVHYQSYLETNDLNDEDVFAILIINHQRNKPLESREPIHENQIKLSKRNGSLIIETITLLRLFEKFKHNEISTDECIELLSNNIGLLSVDSF